MKSKLTLLFVLLAVCSNVFGQQAPAKSDTLALLLQNSNTANKNFLWYLAGKVAVGALCSCFKESRSNYIRIGMHRTGR